MLRIKSNKLESIIIIIIGLVILLLSLRIPNNPIQLKGNVLMKILTEAKFLPILLSVIIILLGINMFYDKRQEDCEYIDVKSIINTITKNHEVYRTLIVIGITFVYVYLIGKVDFIIATILYFLCTFTLLKFKEIKSNFNIVGKILIITAVFSAFIAYVLPKLLRMPIP